MSNIQPKRAVAPCSRCCFGHLIFFTGFSSSQHTFVPEVRSHGNVPHAVPALPGRSERACSVIRAKWRANRHIVGVLVTLAEQLGRCGRRAGASPLLVKFPPWTPPVVECWSRPVHAVPMLRSSLVWRGTPRIYRVLPSLGCTSLTLVYDCSDTLLSIPPVEERVLAERCVGLQTRIDHSVFLKLCGSMMLTLIDVAIGSLLW